LLRKVIWQCDVVDVHARKLARRVAKKALEGRVCHPDSALRPGKRHADSRALEDRAEQCFALFQCRLGFLVRGDVLQLSQVIEVAALFVTHRRDSQEPVTVVPSGRR
jgi:hypothetical protein